MEKERELKILVINGSPQKERSSTSRVTKKFLQGIEEIRPCQIEWLDIDDCKILPCKGCLSCWGRTEGECVIKGDDIPSIKEKVSAADIVIESFPLYIFGMPGTMKVFTDRMVSMLCTYEGQAPVVGKPFHGIRGGLTGKKFIIISTCGYSQADLIYDSLLSQFDMICGRENYYPLFCPQGRSFANEQLFERLEEFLEKFVEAGRELARTEKISEETIAKLREGPFSQRHYKLLMDLFWKTERAAGKKSPDAETEK